MAENARSTTDLLSRAEALRAEAERRESCARAMHRIAADFRRWGLCEQESEARHGARAMRIAALLERAKAACLLEAAGQTDRLSR